MKIVNDSISLIELEKMSEKMFSSLVKAVVDVEKEIMVVDADMHADEELFLLEEHESNQNNLWGINLYPEKYGSEDWIEFDSMINIRPAQQNRSRSVENSAVCNRIRAIVNKLIVP